jgi:YbgC/YbaW family acyl-CoA thioester hydrolase
MSVIYDRACRFEEVDAAGIAFFARFFYWCHEAMEHFFNDVPGGYAALILKRKIGFPAVHVTADWKTPLRYGDVVHIETSTTKIGTTSTTFRHVLMRTSDNAHVATIEHVVVSMDLVTMAKIPLPDDCRALLEKHRA